ncbi:hypothetical protein E4T66_18650 [Sinimarinibacterium sp. CAU 1509]|uniref:hypothetical protein n=1 Tax=Sinimarinibacterium sp. CAU 1509 TaxID=2562283 RepID=UPI0010ACEB19|nr:hypothetical protein [Sinimarinibacterium sp. CAU 1509]TJY57428.1 hypothetical protein E4T66_18650 [Sinimarinibacterium sp. CAU 1509]
MSAVYSCDVFCDDCGNWSPSFTKTRRRISAGLARSARAAAKQGGWVRVLQPDGRYVDLCPRCQQMRGVQTSNSEISS